jgi:hypothetical protein
VRGPNFNFELELELNRERGVQLGFASDFESDRKPEPGKSLPHQQTNKDWGCFSLNSGLLLNFKVA